LFTGTLASGNHTGAWLTDHGHVRGVRHVPGWDRLDTALGLGRRRMDEYMIEGPVTPQPIAAVLTDVDGTLVTSAKVVTKRAIEAIEKLHQRGVLFAITSGRPPRGMRMLVHPLEMRGPIAAFNGGIIVQPDMTIVDERPVPAEVAPAVIDVIGAHGLYPWIYRGTEWYVTDPDAPHAMREARPSSSSQRSYPVTTVCWTGRPRSSASVMTTTGSSGAGLRCSSSSGRASQPPGRSRTTSM
jgi:hypothetical protein